MRRPAPFAGLVLATAATALDEAWDGNVGLVRAPEGRGLATAARALALARVGSVGRWRM